MKKLRKNNNGKNEEKAIVSFGLGATLNAGDFESVKVNFSLSMECPINEIQATIKKVKTEVKKQIKLEINEVKGILKR